MAYTSHHSHDCGKIPNLSEVLEVSTTKYTPLWLRCVVETCTEMLYTPMLGRSRDGAAFW